jgi:cellulose synthase/poly-beta-1,6-N-acetylglucosamine synthase-like glycosyltransferase
MRYLRLPARIGKNLALNRLHEIARGELLLFCDANSRILPGALRSLVGHFADERVGCVTGAERTVADENEFSMDSGNSAFLRYESFVNRRESRLGSVLTCDGALFCIRRKLFTRLDADLANDLELPIYIGAAGFAVLYEPSALAFEATSASPREEFKRRRRICGQGALGLCRLRRQLRGLRLWQFVSRKVLRWLSLLPMAGILLSSAILAAQPLFAGLLLLQAIFYLFALFGLLAAALRRRGGRILDLPFFFVLANLGACVGVLDALLGRRYAVWQPITRVESAPHAAGRGL